MQDEYGETALHTASNKGHIDVARYLLEKGATVNSLSKVRLLYWYSMFLVITLWHRKLCAF